MDTSDFQAFSGWFDVLAVTHRLQASEDMRSQMKAEYFDVLRSYPAHAVESSYQNLRRKMKKWPVPADWLENLPPFGSVGRLPLLTAEEIRENDEAERLGYEAEHFCHCAICERDETTHLKPRYVPRERPEGGFYERQHPRRQGRPVLLGRWIHGHELRRWYVARAGFYALKDKLAPTLRIRQESVADRLARLEAEAKAQIAETRTDADEVNL